MNILEDLWYGNISPWERPFKKDGAYAELLALVIRHQEDLLSRLNDEEKEIFEKYADCTSEMHDLTEREACKKRRESAVCTAKQSHRAGGESQSIFRQKLHVKI